MLLILGGGIFQLKSSRRSQYFGVENHQATNKAK